MLILDLHCFTETPGFKEDTTDVVLEKEVPGFFFARSFEKNSELIWNRARDGLVLEKEFRFVFLRQMFEDSMFTTIASYLRDGKRASRSQKDTKTSR